jgi:hypothetical protein
MINTLGKGSEFAMSKVGDVFPGMGPRCFATSAFLL